MFKENELLHNLELTFHSAASGLNAFQILNWNIRFSNRFRTKLRLIDFIHHYSMWANKSPCALPGRTGCIVYTISHQLASINAVGRFEHFAQWFLSINTKKRFSSKQYFVQEYSFFWVGEIPEGKEEICPLAAKETSMDLSPWVTTNFDVQVFKSEDLWRILLMDASMQFSGTLWLEVLVESMLIQSWGESAMVIMYKFTHKCEYTNSYKNRKGMNSYVSKNIWVHTKAENVNSYGYEFIYTKRGYEFIW